MLSRTDQEFLDFERGWFLYPEPKDRAITEILGVSANVYYHRLRELMLNEQAHAYDPLTIRRLRRIVGAV